MNRARALALVVLCAAPAATFSICAAITKAQREAPKVSYGAIPGGKYQIDPAHSVIGFSIRHYEISWVKGRFKDFQGTVRYDDSDMTRSTVEFTAKVESIDTGVDARNAHLRTADFFDAAKYPEMTFKSTRLERQGKDSYVLYGDFTLRGVIKQISFPFTITGAIKDAQGNTRFGVAAQTKLDRRDYGITWGKPMENGGLDVGNEVMIDLQLEAVKPASRG